MNLFRNVYTSIVFEAMLCVCVCVCVCVNFCLNFVVVSSLFGEKLQFESIERNTFLAHKAAAINHTLHHVTRVPSASDTKIHRFCLFSK